jgi:L-ascorbate metabolism protein UlaG (beta-lactamase superfamily)
MAAGMIRRPGGWELGEWGIILDKYKTKQRFFTVWRGLPPLLMMSAAARYTRILVYTLGLVLGVLLAWLAYLMNSHVSLEPYRDLFLEAGTEQRSGNTVTARYLGNTNVLLSDGETSILTDGFFSNPGMRRVLFGKIAPRPDVIERALARAGVADLAAIIVTHSHYDHVMDAPEVARLSGALFVGSESAANVARGWRFPEARIRVAGPGEPLRFGGFRVTLIRSRHYEFPFSFMNRQAKVNSLIRTPLVPPVAAAEYREGGSYSVLVEHSLGKVLIQGSAGYIKGALRHVSAEVVFLSIGGLGAQTTEYQENYFKETAAAVGATRIIPIHWDDLTRPLDAPIRAPTRFMDLFSRYESGMEFVKRKIVEDPDLNISLMPLWQEVVLFREQRPRDFSK